MLGTIVFLSLFLVLTARLYSRGQRQVAEEARVLPLADDAPRSGGAR